MSLKDTLVKLREQRQLQEAKEHYERELAKHTQALAEREKHLDYNQFPGEPDLTLVKPNKPVVPFRETWTMPTKTLIYIMFNKRQGLVDEQGQYNLESDPFLHDWIFVPEGWVELFNYHDPSEQIYHIEMPTDTFNNTKKVRVWLIDAWRTNIERQIKKKKKELEERDRRNAITELKLGIIEVVTNRLIKDMSFGYDEACSCATKWVDERNYMLVHTYGGDLHALDKAVAEDKEKGRQ